ncbi:hypothetical protein [Treponema sp.]|uniref:hypothetical protein n=1 Tax=Treponema sp. TaxID=166 RepID=UPI003F100DD6
MKSKMKKKCIAFMIFTVLSALLNAEPVVSKFEIHGLKRTKESVVQRDLKKFLGKELTPALVHKIENSLQEDNLFSNISIETSEISETESCVVISLEEKLSVFPLPIVSVNNGEFFGGAFFLDSNALGRKDFFILGGIFSAKSYSGIVSFERPAKGSSFGFGIFTGIAKEDKEINTTEDKTVYDFDTFVFQESVSVSRKFFECLTLSLNTGIEIHNIDSSDEIKGEIESEKAWNIGGQMKFERSDWNGVFMSENSASARTFVNVTTCRDVFNGFELGIKIQQPIFEKLRLIQAASCFFEFEAPVTFYEDRYHSSVSLFPSDFASDAMAGLSAGLEYAAFNTKIGLFSVYAVYQTARAKDLDRSWVFNQGAGGGMKMYLSKVAFPACSLEIIYNITEKEFQTGFSIGMSL